jgi:hypothetical protein
MTIPVALLMVAAQAVSGAQSKSPGRPLLQVGVFSYGPDGKPQAAAYETTLATESLQYIAGCMVGGGNRPVPDRATDAWRVSGKVERMTDDEAVVRVDWQRIRSAGVATTAPGGSIQLTLHPGDRVPLDSATPDSTAGCGARTVGFEARFEPRPGWMIGPNGPLTESPAVTIMRNGASGGGTVTGSGSGGGVGGGAGSGGARAGSGSGGGTGGGSASGGARAGSGSGGSFGRAVSVPGADTPSGVSARRYAADLFLVKTDKARPEEPDFNLQGLILQDVRDKSVFAFSPFALVTPAGPVTVHISGTLQVTTDQGEPQLVFSMTRIVRSSSSGPNRDATSNATGTSTTRNPMPGPDEVVSFELPPIRVPNSSATLPDQYSVRVRIR